MPCIIQAEVVDLTTADDCNLKGGIKIAYWAKYSDIDWTATAANATQWDAANELISGFTMIGGAVWKRIKFNKKGSNYTQSYTKDTSTYETAINLLFLGKGRDFRNAMCKAIRNCKFVVYVFDRNCGERLFGVDWDGDAFNELIEPMSITQHDDNSGEIGGDGPQDSIVIGGEADCPAIYGDIGQTAFEAAYL